MPEIQVYKRILVTMDCTPVDDAIIAQVTALALQNRAEVTLLHVVHSHTLDQDRVLRESAQSALTTRCETLQGQGIDAQILILSGEPDQQILQQIEEQDYSLVAMATHGHSFFGDILFGSVSHKLKHHISVPLLLIGPGR